MITRVVQPFNLQKALEHVIANKGSAGVDGVSIRELRKVFSEKKLQLIEAIKQGNYQVEPILGIEIPKGNGKTRLLGVPTTTERVLQQAVAQNLAPLFEPEFSNYSYGFRPHKNARQAVGQTREYIHSGLNHIVDIDLKNFFDEVDHCLLLNLIYQKVNCKATMQLIRKWLRAPIKINGKLNKRRKGVPQGSPLSPLLSNILLHQLDKEMTRRGHKFVRYADDCMILCKSKRAAGRTLDHIIPFIEDKLYLKVNKDKTVVAHVKDVKFLGHGFYINKGKGLLRVHPKSIIKMKEKIKALTSRSNGWGNERRKEALRQYLTGWVNYFKLANMKDLLIVIDKWYRRRLRMVIWKQWKKIKTRFHNLIKLGISRFDAMMFSNTRKGYWRTAKSPILQTSIDNESLQKAGYLFFSTYYRSVHV